MIFFSNSKKAPTKTGWTQKWIFSSLQYGFSKFSRQLLIARALGALQNEIEPDELKAKLNTSATEEKLHYLMVMCLVTKDEKIMNSDI